MTTKNWRITTNPSVLTEGLFGQIALHVFEILPILYQKRIFPDWKITSLVYGTEPDFTVIPGIFDINYRIKNTKTRDIDLRDLSNHFFSALGNQWEDLHNLWNTYFCIPYRIVKYLDMFGDLSHSLGLHYRGTDKNLDFKQTNPVHYTDFLTLVKDFINNHSDIDTIFIASDESAIKQAINKKYQDKRIIDTGKTGYFRSHERASAYPKGDHALLDCLLLSKCKYLIKNQSALSGFAKVFNPKLEAYRIAANKFCWGIPYFPDAYISPLTSENPKCKKILKRLFEDDWTQNKKAWEKFGEPFFAIKGTDLSLKWKVKTYYHMVVRKIGSRFPYYLRARARVRAFPY